MSQSIKPIHIAIAVVALAVGLFFVYRAFLAEPATPKSPTREEEMKFKGQMSDQYRQSYEKQNQPKPAGQ